MPRPSRRRADNRARPRTEAHRARRGRARRRSAPRRRRLRRGSAAPHPVVVSTRPEAVATRPQAALPRHGKTPHQWRAEHPARRNRRTRPRPVATAAPRHSGIPRQWTRRHHQDGWASAAPRHHLGSLGPHLPPEWRHRRSQNCTHRPRNGHHPRRSAGHVLHRGTGRISSLPVRSHRSHRHWGEGTRPRATRRGSARRSQRSVAHSSSFPLDDSSGNLNTDAAFPSGPGRGSHGRGIEGAAAPCRTAFRPARAGPSVRGKSLWSVSPWPRATRRPRHRSSREVGA